MGKFWNNYFTSIEFLIVHITNLILLSNDIVNRVIFLSVILKKFFLFFKNKGITEPLDPSTLPYRTTENFLFP